MISMKNIFCLLALALTLHSVRIFAQCTPPPAVDCNEIIPVVCMIDGYCGETINAGASMDSLYCHDTLVIPHGAQLISFIASSSDVQLVVNYDDCNGVMEATGATLYGMAAFIFASCPQGDAISLDCGLSATQAGDIIIGFNDAEPGRQYVIMLLGLRGNVCSFSLQMISGVEPLPDLDVPAGNWEGPVDVCPDELAYYVAPEVEGATGYLWELPEGTVAETPLPELQYLWEDFLAEDVYSICVSAMHACDTLTGYACIDVTFRYVVEQNVEALLCPGDVFHFNGEEYDTAGSYELLIDNEEGCDTMITIDLAFYEEMVIYAFLTNDSGASDGTIDLTVEGGVGPFSYAWSNGATTEDLAGLSGGSYTVTVTGATGCVQELTFTVQMQTGILSLADVTPLEIFPNPVSVGQSFLIRASQIEGQHVSIYNTTGVKVQEYSSYTSELPLVLTVPGMYIIQIQDQYGKIEMGRVVVL